MPESAAASYMRRCQGTAETLVSLCRLLLVTAFLLRIDSATALGGRRALRDTLFDGTAKALRSQMASGAQAAVPGRTFASGPTPDAALAPAPAAMPSAEHEVCTALSYLYK